MTLGFLVLATVLASAAPQDAMAQDAAAGASTDAGAATPTVQIVSDLNTILLDLMMSGEEATYADRRSKLGDRLEPIFDFRRMAGVVVGRTGWSAMSPDQRDAYVDAFAEVLAANYAGRFKSWNGHAFLIDGETTTPKGVLVRTTLTRPEDDPVKLDYLLRDTSSGPRIVDIIFNGGVSELAQQRAQYAPVYRDSGYDALIGELAAAAERQKTRADDL